MSNEYTPTLDEVRENYGWNGHDSYIESNREASKAKFDRFIKQYRADVKSEALEEASVAAFNDKKIQGLRRVLIGNWLRNYAAQLKESK